MFRFSIKQYAAGYILSVQFVFLTSEELFVDGALVYIQALAYPGSPQSPRTHEMTPSRA